MKNKKEKCGETHSCCNKRLREEGGKARCCYCFPHEGCEFNQPEEECKHEEIQERTSQERFKLLPFTAQTTESFIAEEIEKARAEAVKKEREAWLKGERCSNCGKEKEPNMLTDLCGKCFQEA